MEHDVRTPLYWDPLDVDIDTDPYDTWRRLRDEAPVYRNEALDFWALSRFADVEAAHRDPQTFCSSHGTVLELTGTPHKALNLAGAGSRTLGTAVRPTLMRSSLRLSL